MVDYCTGCIHLELSTPLSRCLAESEGYAGNCQHRGAAIVGFRSTTDPSMPAALLRVRTYRYKMRHGRAISLAADLLASSPVSLPSVSFSLEAGKEKAVNDRSVLPAMDGPRVHNGVPTCKYIALHWCRLVGSCLGVFPFPLPRGRNRPVVRRRARLAGTGDVSSLGLLGRRHQHPVGGGYDRKTLPATKMSYAKWCARSWYPIGQHVWTVYRRKSLPGGGRYPKSHELVRPRSRTSRTNCTGRAGNQYSTRTLQQPRQVWPDWPSASDAAVSS